MSAARLIQILFFLLKSSVFAGSATPAEQSAVSTPPATFTEITSQAQEARVAVPGPAKPIAQKQPGAAPATKRVPVRRRSVRQAIGSVVQPTPTQTYGPVLTPPAYTYPSQSNPASPPVTPPPPSQLNTCAGSFCTDAAGATYHNAVGSAAVNSQGRLCNRVGNSMQCF